MKYWSISSFVVYLFLLCGCRDDKVINDYVSVLRSEILSENEIGPVDTSLVVDCPYVINSMPEILRLDASVAERLYLNEEMMDTTTLLLYRYDTAYVNVNPIVLVTKNLSNDVTVHLKMMADETSSTLPRLYKQIIYVEIPKDKDLKTFKFMASISSMDVIEFD